MPTTVLQAPPLRIFDLATAFLYNVFAMLSSYTLSKLSHDLSISYMMRLIIKGATFFFHNFLLFPHHKGHLR